MNQKQAQLRREISPYLKFIQNMDSDRGLETRVSHITHDFFEDGINWLSSTLNDYGVTVGFSVPAVYLESADHIRKSIRKLSESGHEIVVHGYRHTSFMETSYETASRELSTAYDVFDRNFQLEPVGFHVPFMRCSPGTVRAAKEQGVEWIVGTSSSERDSSLTYLTPQSPYDLQLIEQGLSPTEVTAKLNSQAEYATLMLCHPNIHVCNGSMEAFAEWLAERSFTTPSTAANGDTAQPGLLLDCFPPFRVK